MLQSSMKFHKTVWTLSNQLASMSSHFHLSFKTMRIKLLLAIATAIILSGCVPPPPPAGTGSIEELQQLNVPPPSRHGYHHAPQISSLRVMELKDIARSIGAQSGLSWRAKQIDCMLTIDTKKLDATYNFYGQLLNNSVLPPVLVEANNTLNLADPDTIRLSEKIYKILKQTHFVPCLLPGVTICG